MRVVREADARELREADRALGGEYCKALVRVECVRLYFY